MLKNNLFNFRRYKKKEGDSKKRHPKLIVDENNVNYGFMGLTEKRKKGKHHNNIPLIKNPKKGDSRPAYLRKKISYDIKENFGEILKDYNLSNKDKKDIIAYVNKKLKKWSIKKTTYIAAVISSTVVVNVNTIQ